MTRRILYVIDGLNVGGAEMLLLDLLDAARVRGDETHVAYFSPGPLVPKVRARGAGMTRLGRRGLRDPFVLMRAVRLIRTWRPDIVHTHLTKSDLVGQLAARLTGCRRAITLHNTSPWRKRRVLSGLYRIATGGADACIAVSDQVADHVAAHGGYRRDRIEVVVNGVDLVRFDAARVAPMDLAPLGVPAGSKVVAVIGRLVEQKDHATFLAAAAALAARDPAVHFLLAGDGPLRDEIADRAAALGLGPGRLSMPGNVDDMPGLLAATDVFVLSSAWEGLPMALLEAMAMGCAIVSTAVGGIPAVIRDGETGRLVSPADPAALADAIGTVLADDAARRAMGEAARVAVRDRFDGAAMIDRLCAIYTADGATSDDSGGALRYGARSRRTG